MSPQFRGDRFKVFIFGGKRLPVTLSPHHSQIHNYSYSEEDIILANIPFDVKGCHPCSMEAGDSIWRPPLLVATSRVGWRSCSPDSKGSASQAQRSSTQTEQNKPASWSVGVLRRCGGTGRRTRLKIVRSYPCGFESHHRYFQIYRGSQTVKVDRDIWALGVQFSLSSGTAGEGSNPSLDLQFN